MAKGAEISSATRVIPGPFCDVCRRSVFDLARHVQTGEHKGNLRRIDSEKSVPVVPRPIPGVRSVLTPKQTLVLSYLRDGYMAKEVADLLGRSVFTIKIMVRDLRSRLKARNTTQAVVIAIRKGLIELGE